jgi:hypothetical protein
MPTYKTGNFEFTLNSVTLKFNIEHLEFSRQFNYVRWLYNLFSSKIDCDKILELININVPNSTLDQRLLIIFLLANVTTDFLHR